MHSGSFTWIRWSRIRAMRTWVIPRGIGKETHSSSMSPASLLIPGSTGPEISTATHYTSSNDTHPLQRTRFATKQRLKIRRCLLVRGKSAWCCIGILNLRLKSWTSSAPIWWKKRSTDICASRRSSSTGTEGPWPSISLGRFRRAKRYTTVCGLGIHPKKSEQKEDESNAYETGFHSCCRCVGGWDHATPVGTSRVCGGI